MSNQTSNFFPRPYSEEVFDHVTFDGGFNLDIRRSQRRIITHDPFLDLLSIEKFLASMIHAGERGIKMCMFVKEPLGWGRENDSRLTPLQRARLIHFRTDAELLGTTTAHVNLRRNVHEKIIVIDDDIIWDGSLNIFSYGKSSERMTRYVCRDKLEEAIKKHRLEECAHCMSEPSVDDIRSSMRLDEAAIGDLIRVHRERLGWSQDDLATRIGTHRLRISRLERGLPTPLDFALAVTQAVGCELSWLPDTAVQALYRLNEAYKIKERMAALGRT